jgi:hypothetical protein
MDYDFLFNDEKEIVMSKKINLTAAVFISAALLLISSLVFAEGYQSQNKADNKSSNQHSQSESSHKIDDSHSHRDSIDKRDVHSDGPRGDAAEADAVEEKSRKPGEANK